jgi:transcriptional regulator GlxA family with amidase domain
MHIIECALAEPISVEELARSLDVSYGYISRLFRAETGDSVVAYIRRRRADRAEHLLRHSTMSIASIAASVGIPDLQQFNRLIHQTLGSSPRDVRFARRP